MTHEAAILGNPLVGHKRIRTQEFDLDFDFETNNFSEAFEEEMEDNDNENDSDSEDFVDKTSASYNAITLAFSKTRTNDRKQWLLNYNKSDIIENDVQQISYTDFINKDFKHFSFYDILRSIPSMCDGFRSRSPISPSFRLSR